MKAVLPVELAEDAHGLLLRLAVENAALSGVLLASRLWAGLLRNGDAVVPAPDLRPLVGALGARLAVGGGALAAVKRGHAALALGAVLGALLTRKLLVIFGGEEVQYGFVLGQLRLQVYAGEDPADAALERRGPCIARLFQATAAVGVAAEEQYWGPDADVCEALRAQLAARDRNLSLGVGGRVEIDHVGSNVNVVAKLGTPLRPAQRHAEVDAVPLEGEPAKREGSFVMACRTREHLLPAVQPFHERATLSTAG